MRPFEDKPATREATPLLLGLVGPSGTGKTYSALRLATGIQRVDPGEIFLIDTESRRSLHYAELFRFRHVAFGAPFSPLDYLAAMQHCVAKGAKTIIVDSMSHEHEGPGGVLEMHEAETKRLAALWKCSEYTAQMSAWSKPKAERRRMINTILQLPVNLIFCFRAKEKLRIVKGKDPEQKGFEALAGQEFIYELLVKFLLLPGAKGTPTWQSEMPSEKLLIKLPGQFEALFSRPEQLSEDIGAELAKWAAGVDAPKDVDPIALAMSYDACSDPSTMRALEAERKAAWGRLDRSAKAMLKEHVDAARARLDEAATAPPGARDGEHTPDTQDPDAGNPGPEPREPGEDG